MFCLFSFHNDFYLIAIEVEFRYRIVIALFFLLIFALAYSINFKLGFLFIFCVSTKITEYHSKICRYFST